jgi:uncharacterized protein YdaU (DUF1376 family)
MKRHWMPLYIADYLAGTAHLSTAEHGAYLLLIMHYWSKGGPPQNDEVARRVTRMTNHQWTKSSPILKTFFLSDWRHERLDAELAQVTEKSKTNSANARRSHVARNRGAADPQDTVTLHNHSLSDAEGTPAKSVEKSAFSKEAVSLGLAFLNAAGFADHGAAPNSWYDVSARAAMWIEAGYPTTMILKETMIVAAKSATYKPIQYFEKVFATAFARLQQPLPVAIVPEPEKANVISKVSRRGAIHDALGGQIVRAQAIQQNDAGGSVAGSSTAPRLLPSR